MKNFSFALATLRITTITLSAYLCNAYHASDTAGSYFINCPEHSILSSIPQYGVSLSGRR